MNRLSSDQSKERVPSGKLLKWSVQGRTGFLFFHKKVSMVDIFFPALSAEYRMKIFSRGVDPIDKPLPKVSRRGVKFVGSILHSSWHIRWICYRKDLPVSYFLIDKNGFASLFMKGRIRFVSQDWSGVAMKGPSLFQVKKIHRLVKER